MSEYPSQLTESLSHRRPSSQSVRSPTSKDHFTSHPRISAFLPSSLQPFFGLPFSLLPRGRRGWDRPIHSKEEEESQFTSKVHDWWRPPLLTHSLTLSGLHLLCLLFRQWQIFGHGRSNSWVDRERADLMLSTSTLKIVFPRFREWPPHCEAEHFTRQSQNLGNTFLADFVHERSSTPLTDAFFSVSVR